MECSIRRALAVAVVLFCFPACDKGRLDPTMGPVTIDAGNDSGPGSCSGTTGASLKGEVPAEHRVAATPCSPSTRRPADPDGGLPSYTSDADCVGDGGSPFTTCLHGTCSFDQCLSDSDCGSGVCGCASDYYGGNAAFHPNVCVQAGCHIDSDCGPGGFCSPSRGRCGSYEGFYCHGSADTCVDPTKDCGGCASACVYTPTIGAFVCGGAVCNG